MLHGQRQCRPYLEMRRRRPNRLIGRTRADRAGRAGILRRKTGGPAPGLRGAQELDDDQPHVPPARQAPRRRGPDCRAFLRRGHHRGPPGHRLGTGPRRRPERRGQPRDCTRACATGRSARTAAAASPPSRACASSRARSTWAPPAAACGRRPTAARCGTPVSDGQIETGSIGAIAVADSNPGHRLGGDRQRGHPQQRHHRPRRLQVGRRRPDVDAGRPAGRRPDRVGGDPSRQPRHRVGGRGRLALRPDRRCAASTRPPTAARPGRARCS